MNTFEGLTEKQQETFGRIAMNDDSKVFLQTAKVLKGLGLVEEYDEQISPNFTIKRYFVPMPIHIKWCQWCAENEPDD